MIFESEQIDTVEIWGRSIELRIVADLFPGEAIDTHMQETYQNIKAKEQAIFNEVYNALEKYFYSKKDFDLGEKEFNIYSFFIPKALYIKKSNKNRVAGLFLKYRFDMENDIVAIIENEHVISIGTQDDIL